MKKKEESTIGAIDRLILPTDVLILPVNELGAEFCSRAKCNDNDFAISRPRSRTSVKVIDMEAATLLEEFRKPQNILEAVVKYSLKRKVDPEEVLNNAFPLLRFLRESRLLVPVQSEEANQIEASIPIGTLVDNFEVIECVQVLTDIEVYQVKDHKENLYALKILRQLNNKRALRSLERESAILMHLDGTYNPKLAKVGWYQEKRYLVMEWCSGETASIIAGDIRQSSGRKELLDYCYKILEAFAGLHAQGIIHGDIHPRNILFDEDKNVKVLDFGLTRFDQELEHLKESTRGGVGFYFEPEYAKLYLLNKNSKPTSKKGEQYALGALLYLLLTGRHYLDFSLVKMEMFRQISEELPMSFDSRGIDPWPDVEIILTKALNKNPEKRFSNVAEFAHQLQSVLENGYEEKKPKYNIKPIHEEEFLNTILRRYSNIGTLISKGLPDSPSCSVNFGAAGIAYMFYRISCLRNDPLLLSTADIWINRAKIDSEEKSAFYNHELGITENVIGPVSLYHTITGVHCVQALISQAMGDFHSLSHAINQFIIASQKNCNNLDLTLGRSSILIGCSLLLDSIPLDGSVDSTPLINLGKNISEGIWSQINTYRAIKECNELTWLGMAHGWAGILYAELRWCQALGITPNAEVEERLWQLAEYAETKGRGVCWKRREGFASGDNVAWPGWCHGTAGYVHLWTTAYSMYGDAKYINLAEKSAWHTWTELDKTSSNLCCGLSGQSYALINIYKYTGDKKWLERARKIGNIAINGIGSYNLRNHSLYKGDVGVALLAEELSNPEYACMPLFESEQSLQIFR